MRIKIIHMSEAQCEKAYNKILKQVEGHIGKDTTYSETLDDLGSSLFGEKFAGIFPSDKIPALSDKTPYCVLNVDKSNQPGSHWVSLVKHGNHCIFYDSFGRKGSKLIPDLLFSGNGRLIDTDKDKEQKIKETNCGARALAFLVFYDKFGAKKALKI